MIIDADKDTARAPNGEGWKKGVCRRDPTPPMRQHSVYLRAANAAEAYGDTLFSSMMRRTEALSDRSGSLS